MKISYLQFIFWGCWMKRNGSKAFISWVLQLNWLLLLYLATDSCDSTVCLCFTIFRICMFTTLGTNRRSWIFQNLRDFHKMGNLIILRYNIFVCTFFMLEGRNKKVNEKIVYISKFFMDSPQDDENAINYVVFQTSRLRLTRYTNFFHICDQYFEWNLMLMWGFRFINEIFFTFWEFILEMFFKVLLKVIRY